MVSSTNMEIEAHGKALCDLLKDSFALASCSISKTGLICTIVLDQWFPNFSKYFTWRSPTRSLFYLRSCGAGVA